MAIPRPTGGPPGQGGGLPSAINQTGSQGQSATQVDTSTTETCILTPSLIEIEGTPQQTEGPYFVDGMPNRTDITSNTLNGAVQDGIPLTLVINVYDSSDGSCIPISGSQVDIWHANFQGIYSGVQEQGTAGNNFLRGYQVTDENGTVRFTTVYRAGMREERSTFTSRFGTLKDRRKRSNGLLNSICLIRQMSRFILSHPTVIMAQLTWQMNRTEFTQVAQQTAWFKVIQAGA